jgi:glycosyltransferase involved in cell wall biosynthesis
MCSAPDRAAQKISVIATVLNEAATIDRLLDSLVSQTVSPDEVVVVDGGSTDGTRQRLAAWDAAGRLPLRIIDRPGANISQGRNTAISAAAGPLIASVDAGVRVEPTWLERLVAPLAEGRAAAAGFFKAAPDGAFEAALAAVTLPRAEEIDPAAFLPSSRSVAFTKAAWLQAEGYPEWLDYCEDLVFDFRLIEATGSPAFVPDAVVWFRPRSSYRAFFLQYYRYARGDGKADLWARRHLIRYAVYGLALPAAVGAAAWGAAGVLHENSGGPVAGAGLAVLLVGAVAFVANPLRRLRGLDVDLGWSETIRAVAWIPVLRVTGDVAKMVGYPVGLAWRLRHRPPAWRPRPEH